MKPKVVLVTGASSGIGKAIAQHLSEEGCRVFGAQRHVTEEPAAAPLIQMIAMDVNDDTSVQDGVRLVAAQAGRIDAVVNCAGNAWMGSVEDTSIDEARAQLETNFFGVLRVCHAVLPIMREQANGYIINISSLAGVLGLPFSGLYSASKFALEGMTESLRWETKRHGIRVVLIEPGDFRSQLATTRRTVVAAGHKSAYRDAFEKFKAQQENDEAGAPSPEPIGALVERILQTPSPRLRYSAGMLMQRIVIPLKRLLPQSVFEPLLRLVLGL